MMIKQYNPNIILFSGLLILSTLMFLTMSTWILMWTMLEINLMSITPLLLHSQKSYEMESGVKYFLIQSVSSVTLLLSIFMYISSSFTDLSIWIMLFSILMKMGSAPCHMWIPPIMTNLSWLMLFTLSSWQKIPPLFMLTNMSFFWSTSLLITLISINAMIGSLGGINQTQSRPLLAYSSITHMAWMLSSLLISFYLFIIYFLSYSLILWLVILSLSNMEINFTNNFSTFLNSTQNSPTILFLHILSLAGLPPFMGFFPKWMVLKSLYSLTLIAPSILITASLISLFYYLNLFIASQHFKKSITMYEPNMLTTYIFMIMLTPLPIFATFLWMWMNHSYDLL